MRFGPTYFSCSGDAQLAFHSFFIGLGRINAEVKTREVQAMYGQIIAFTLWIYQLYRPIRQLADKFNVLQQGIVRAERIFK